MKYKYYNDKKLFSKTLSSIRSSFYIDHFTIPQPINKLCTQDQFKKFNRTNIDSIKSPVNHQSFPSEEADYKLKKMKVRKCSITHLGRFEILIVLKQFYKQMSNQSIWNDSYIQIQVIQSQKKLLQTLQSSMSLQQSLKRD
ncbi:unnamed protein product [Paramecium octaurelia]|uniref:Uncharacterized protein n=1 Tax=Paramecium octaurelia TaxID=43137 RepID=A0A8S1SJA4_PAROT|nr:unnamed protein product [Paramecium octaurelia]